MSNYIPTLLALGSAALLLNPLYKAKAISICDAVSQNIVVNCGFESDSNSTPVPSGWTANTRYLNHAGAFNRVVSSSGDIITGSANSGSNFLYYGHPDAGDIVVNQPLATLAGTTYNVSFSLKFTGVGLIEIDQHPSLASIIYSTSNNSNFIGLHATGWDDHDSRPVQPVGWASYSYSFLGTGTDTLFFAAVGTAEYGWGLDDVVVTAGSVQQPEGIPEPAASAMFLTAVTALALGYRRTARDRTYTGR